MSFLIGSYRPPRAVHTLARVACLRGPLRDALAGPHHSIRQALVHDGKVERYVAYERINDPFLLVVSKSSPCPLIDPDPLPYNAIVTITSYSSKHNKRLARQLSRETGIALTVNASPRFEPMYQGMNRLFTRLLEQEDYLSERWNLHPL